MPIYIYVVQFFDKMEYLFYPQYMVATICWIGFIGLYVILGIYEKVQGLTPDRELKKRNYHGTFYWAGLGPTIAFGFGHDWFIQHWSVSSLTTIYLELSFWVGSFVAIIGIVVVVWARLYLNGYWGPFIYTYTGESNIEKRKPFVDNGLYKIIRHPIYLGQLLLTLGTFIISWNWLFVILPLSTLILNEIRAGKEEDHLKKQHGDKYIAYKDKTYRLVPGIY